MPDEERRLCLSDGIWAAYDRSGDLAEWEFIDSVHHDADDPAGAARRACIEKWASGSHRILVVNLDGAAEFTVTIESEPVDA